MVFKNGVKMYKPQLKMTCIINYYLSCDVYACFRLCLSLSVFLQKTIFGEQTSRILDSSPRGLISSTIYSIWTSLGKSLSPLGIPSPELTDRCCVAARVMREMAGTMIIPTGGDPVRAGVTEAEVMSGLMQQMGVPAEMIVLEQEAKVWIFLWNWLTPLFRFEAADFFINYYSH